MELDLAAGSSSARPKAVHQSLPLKNASMNPYIPRYPPTSSSGSPAAALRGLMASQIGVYTNLATAATKSHPLSKPQLAKVPFVNPYVNTRPPKSAPDPLSSSTSSGNTGSLGNHSKAAPMAEHHPAAPSSTRLDSSQGAHASHSAIFVDRSTLNAKPGPSTPAASASSRQKSRLNRVSHLKSSLPANTNPPPGPDSTWIPKNLALKMRYTDFKVGEYVVRDDWGPSMKFPDNLDPPNGLQTLRCLFCEKQYAGVNARSMWRRHVSQKHDVVLSGAKNAVVFHRPRPRKPSKALKEFTRPSNLRRQFDEEYDADTSFNAGAEEASSDEEIEGPLFEAAFMESRFTTEVESDVDDQIVAALADEDDLHVERLVSEPVLVANGWDEDDDSDLSLITPFQPQFTSILLPHDSQHSHLQSSNMRTPRSEAPLRRTVSTPAYLVSHPSPTHEISPFAFTSDRSPSAVSLIPSPSVLLPAFEQSAQPSTSTTLSARTLITIPEFQPSQEAPAPVDIATRALKKHKLGLLPGITLVPALKSPRALPEFSPSASGISRSLHLTRAYSTWTGLSSDAGPSNSGEASTHQRPTTPEEDAAVQCGLYSEPGALSTPAPARRKRALTESERLRWIMALESPGPLGRSSSSAINSSPDLMSTRLLASSPQRHFLPSGSSPLHHLQASASSSHGIRHSSSFIMPPPSLLGTGLPLQPSDSFGIEFRITPIKNDFDFTGTPGTAISSASRPRRTRSFSLFSTPGSKFHDGISGLSLRSSTSDRPTPDCGDSHTRNSSVGGDTLDETSYSTSGASFLEDDPFRSLNLDASTSSLSSASQNVDHGALVLKEFQSSTSRMFFGSSVRSNMSSSGTSVSGFKRGRNHEDTDISRAILSSATIAPSDLTPEMLEAEIDSYDWDRDMSPVKKKARSSFPT